jgi:RNA polymerase sigma-70 factor (ECF subfamily)
LFRVDADTIDAARRGDRRALSRLLSALQDVWYRFCLSLLHDPDRAMDATQETGLRFLKQIAHFRGESQIQTWSLGIALNVVREIRRRRDLKSDTELDELAAERSSAGSAELKDETDMLQQTLATLPDRQREALVLRFFEDLSVEQTATAMGCAQGTVKATVFQALRALREKMKSSQ